MADDGDTLTLELETDREIAAFMIATGHVGRSLTEIGDIEMGADCSNLQIRLCSEHDQTVVEALEEYGDGGNIPGIGVMPPQAGVARMADEDEIDPEEALEEFEDTLL